VRPPVSVSLPLACALGVKARARWSHSAVPGWLRNMLGLRWLARERECRCVRLFVCLFDWLGCPFLCLRCRFGHWEADRLYVVSDVSKVHSSHSRRATPNAQRTPLWFPLEVVAGAALYLLGYSSAAPSGRTPSRPSKSATPLRW
jgi:hypothetical protein